MDLLFGRNQGRRQPFHVGRIHINNMIRQAQSRLGT